MKHALNKRRGIKNDYRSGMPLPELVYKEIVFSFQELANYLKNGFRSKTILAWPDFPSRHSALYKLCRHMNYNLTNKLERSFDVAVYYEDTTFRKHYEVMENIAKSKRVINLHSRDISKINVEKAFSEVFGYSSFCDPTTYHGKCVKKSDANATHDGIIIDCPVSHKEEGFIYQIVLDNETGDNLHKDIRVPIMAGEIPYVFYQYRLPVNRFSIAKRASLVPTKEALSEKEKSLILKLSIVLNLEFGEMDVIRHKKDQKIYVIDVNNTPSTRARLFNKKQFKPFLKNQEEIFKQKFINS